MIFIINKEKSENYSIPFFYKLSEEKKCNYEFITRNKSNYLLFDNNIYQYDMSKMILDTYYSFKLNDEDKSDENIVNMYVYKNKYNPSENILVKDGVIEALVCKSDYGLSNILFSIRHKYKYYTNRR